MRLGVQLTKNIFKFLTDLKFLGDLESNIEDKNQLNPIKSLTLGL